MDTIEVRFKLNHDMYLELYRLCKSEKATMNKALNEIISGFFENKEHIADLEEDK